MDRKLRAHFDEEARDDVEAVLGTLTADVEHDVAAIMRQLMSAPEGTAAA